MKIPLASLGIRDKDIEAAIETLRSGNLTMGTKVQKFEQQMANFLGCKNFVMTNSGSSANLSIFEALMRPSKSKPFLKANDGVLVPAISWPTTVWPIIQLGLKPYFVEIQRDELTMDLNHAQQIIDNFEGRIKAIFPIHFLGSAINSDDLVEFAQKNNLILINDVCESLGSSIKGQHTGICGVAASFSFYFSHHITTMEGGGVATNDYEFADDLRSIRSHGWSRDRSDAKEWSKNLEVDESKFLFISTGFNIRPMEVQAAIGISQLEDVEDFLERRRKIADFIYDSIKDSDFTLLGYRSIINQDLRSSNSWMLLPIKINLDKYKSKKHVTQKLNLRGIETRPVLTGNFLNQPALKRIYPNEFDENNYIQSNELSESTFLVSCHHSLSDVQIEFLADELKKLS